MTCRSLGLLALLPLLAGHLNAAILLSDQFDYSDGPLVEVSGAKWKTHSGTTGQAQVVAGQLHLAQRNSEDVNAGLPGGPITKTNATAIYARFKLRYSGFPSGKGGFLAHFKDASATAGFRCRIFASTNNAARERFQLGLSAGANAASALIPDQLELDTVYVVVCRLVLADNASTLWLNPKNETDSSITATDEVTAKAVTAFAFRESLASGSGTGELSVDDLIVATAFSDLQEESPEPGFRLSVSRTVDGTIRIAWKAEPLRAYSIWASDTSSDPMSPLATELWFWDDAGWFEETAVPGAMRLYRVCLP